jgi:hypothetical protein
MNDRLEPIFPPQQPNYSAGAVEHAEAALDDETRSYVLQERARLTHGTGLAVFAVAEATGLPSEVSEALSSKLTEEVRKLSPEYHKYVNKLLEGVAQVVTSQPKTADHQELASAPQADSSSSTVADEAGTDSFFEPHPELLVEMSEGMKLCAHLTTPKSMRKFVADVLPDEQADEVAGLSARALSLTAYQLLVTYRDKKIMQASPDRKMVQIERLEKILGLFDSPKSVEFTSRELGVSGASIHQGINRVKESLRSVVQDPAELIEKARYTAERKADIFSTEPVEASLVEKLETVQPGPAKTAELLAPETEFFKHFKTPANMQNFLLKIFPFQYGDGILSLNQWHSSLLTFQLIERSRSFVGRGITHSSASLHATRLERWTGLYEREQDFTELSERLVLSKTQVQTGIESSIDRIERNIPAPILKELFENVCAVSGAAEFAASRASIGA